MGFPSIFSKILDTLQPVYDVAQFGEDVVLFPAGFTAAVLNTNSQGYASGALPLLVARQAVALTTSIANAGGTQDWEFQIDMPAWLFGLSWGIITDNTAGGAILWDVALILRVQGQTDKTICTVSYAPAGGVRNVLLHTQGAIVFLPQHAKIVLRLTNNAGLARNVETFNAALDLASFLKVHLHPHINHADVVFGTERAS